MKKITWRFNLYAWMAVASLILSACAASTPTPASLAGGGMAPSTETTLPPSPVPSESPTPAPAATVPSSPTPEPPPKIIPEAVLYVLELNQPEELPSDLLEQLYYFSVGGAGGGGSGEPSGKPPYWKTSYNNEIEPAIPGTLSWKACSFLESPLPQAVLTLPDGLTVKLEVELGTLGEICAGVSYQIVPGAPLGTYSLLVTQGDAELFDSVILEMPTEPIHGYYQDADWFAGFQPGESITVSLNTDSDIYSPYTPNEVKNIKNQGDLLIFYLLKLEVITADRYGSFQLRVKPPDDFSGDIYISVQGISGALSQHPEGGWMDIVWPDICARPIQLQIGDIVQVANDSDPVPSIMGYMQHRVVYLPAGTTMQVKLGPFCLYHSWTWVVETADYGQILMRESNSLEPVTP